MTDVSVTLLRAVVGGAAARGVAPAELLRAAGLEASALDEPDRFVSRASEVRLWCEAARLANDEHFGLHLSEQLKADMFGALGFAVRSSPTIGRALSCVARYLQLLVRGPTLRIVVDGPLARVRHTPPLADPRPSRHGVEFLMGNLLELTRRGGGPEVAARSITFQHPLSAEVSEYQRVLRLTPTFAGAHDEIVLDRDLLEAPQLEAEPALGDILDQHLSSLLVSAPSTGTFLERVRSALSAELATGEPTLTQIAASLSMSERSLQRKLRDEGTSLSALLDQVRADIAVRHLAESKQSIAEVAFLLGFSEVSTFHRAFRRWTGVTPATYRRAPAGA
ncbi:MAG: AraC family transcriptional regulator [Polyangiaceae bacterium]